MSSPHDHPDFNPDTDAAALYAYDEGIQYYIDNNLPIPGLDAVEERVASEWAEYERETLVKAFGGDLTITDDCDGMGSPGYKCPCCGQIHRMVGFKNGLWIPDEEGMKCFYKLAQSEELDINGWKHPKTE